MIEFDKIPGFFDPTAIQGVRFLDVSNRRNNYRDFDIQFLTGGHWVKVANVGLDHEEADRIVAQVVQVVNSRSIQSVLGGYL